MVLVVEREESVFIAPLTPRSDDNTIVEEDKVVVNMVFPERVFNRVVEVIIEDTLRLGPLLVENNPVCALRVLPAMVEKERVLDVRVEMTRDDTTRVEPVIVDV